MKRVYVLGASRIPDPFSTLSFSDSWEQFCKLYPTARHTQVFESDGIPTADGEVMYEVAMLPSKTNG